jgi:Family of unknown function (DUF5686)/CarboxypepD_reg-like domain
MKAFLYESDRFCFFSLPQRQNVFRFSVTVCFLFFTLFLVGQVTLTGVILDKHSKEPVPFANFYLQSNPTKGVSGDFDGNFEITFPTAPDILEVSALGYETYVLKYEGKNVLKIELEASALNLAEVVVTTKGEDPAYGIMRQVIKNKPKNDLKNFEVYSCEVYNKMEVDLINISEEFKNLKLNRPFDFVFDHIDSTSEEEPFLPLFVSEALSDFFFQKNPKRQNEQIKALKVAGDYENESVGQLLGVAEAQFNAYDNWVDLVSKKFAGPVSDNGTNFYRYYLIDTAFIDNKWCYQIQYFPKHKGLNTFYGDIWVHDSTFAIKKIKLQLLSEVHLNFIEKLSIIQEYQFFNDSIWVPKKEYITVTSTTVTAPFVPQVFKKLRENAPGVQAKRNTTYKDFKFDPLVVEQGLAQEIKVLPDAFKKGEAYWAERRHVELVASEKTAYFLIDTIKELPVIDLWEKITTTLFTGYVAGKYIEVGNVYEFLSSNDIEGFRTKFGFATSTGISKKFLAGAYGAYGWQDKEWKYAADFVYFFRKNPRRTIGFGYIKDYSPTPNFTPFFSLSGEGVGTSYFLRRNIPFKLLDVEHLAVNYFYEWKMGLSARITLSNENINPLFNFDYVTDGETSITDYENTEASVEFRYAYDELYLVGNYGRTSLGSKYPVVSFKYTKGFKDILDSDLDFNAFELTITDKFRWGAIGYTRMRLTAGQILGNVPYTNMFIPVGNEGFIMNLSGFNSIAEYTFAMDRFAQINLDHHFEGFILGVVPLFRKMRLRSVANFRAIIGDMSDSNRTKNAANLFENTTDDDAVRIRIPNREPFMEASVGIENIFRFFRFDAIWRLNYNGDVPGNRFGIRGSIHFAL